MALFVPKRLREKSEVIFQVFLKEIVVAIDGKIMWGTAYEKVSKKAIHFVNAWCSENRVYSSFCFFLSDIDDFFVRYFKHIESVCLRNVFGRYYIGRVYSYP